MAQDQFTAFVLDQLSELPELRVRRMFGGQGLYCRGNFFAILYLGRLYFKVSAHTRGLYESRGSQPFTYERGKRIVSLSYLEVPPGILEDRQALTDWAWTAVTIRDSRSGGKRRARTARPRRKT